MIVTPAIMATRQSNWPFLAPIQDATLCGFRLMYHHVYDPVKINIPPIAMSIPI
jgi:hypothetical protein